MEMRTSRAPGRADAANELASLDRLSLGHIDVRQVSVSTGEPAAVVDYYQLAIAVLPAYERHLPAGSRNNWVTTGCVNILAGVELKRTPAKGVPATAETAFQFSDYRPN